MSRLLISSLRRSAAVIQRPDPRACFSRCHQSTSAADAADNLMSRFANKTNTVSQVLDGNQLQKLSLSLMRKELWPGQDISTRTPADGTPLPPGYHLVFLTPLGVEAELGEDGTDSVFNAPAPFSRRMWAGGRMRWEKEDLRVGDSVEERTRLVSAVAKKSRDGADMVIVGVEKQFWGPRGLALVDERSWIFRPLANGASPAAEKALRDAVVTLPSSVEDVSQDGAYPQRNLRWSMMGLFRFSALTFNAHKIHYDTAWSTAIESHPACVVHGPLNLINMLDYWRDFCAAKGRRVKEISYRAVAPLYVGEKYQVSAQQAKEEESRWEMLVAKEGKACMKGDILGEK
ncbi:hypothetical protein GGS21DRAFT_124830 [Xylaria nigripes]|nr:hypothetical protein GGS21DRAFT_124830 [Xylaria nigripes]